MSFASLAAASLAFFQAAPGGAQLARLSAIDVIVVALYFGIVIFIGFYLKGATNTSEQFFMAGREMTAWIAGLSFVSANLGALELMGWAGSAYQYGILAMHWYWIGAIPAMLFLGLVMMPFYYVSKTHSVPGYLKLRFGESSRVLAALSFATEMILMSGVNMFSMAVVMKVVLGWNITFSIFVSSLAVAAYVALGGLRSAIYNEVLQFCLIWGGALLIPILGLVEAGGFSGLKTKIIANMGNASYLHLWSTTAHFRDNPMGIHWTGIVFGLGFVVSFGYWTTDFLVVQRVLAAHNLRAAQMAPVIGSYFKMAVPFIVILPGLLGLVLLKNPDGTLMHLVGQNQLSAANPHSYNEVLPLMLVRYCGPGLLGLGVTALLAGFMSGMAGNVSAFSTVWTYDIYRPHIRKGAPDQHYVAVGRWATILGVLVSICAAYLVMHAAGIMDYVQALFSLFLAPLLGVILLGMFWTRATAAGGFWGLLSGILSSASLFAWVHEVGPKAMAIVAFSPDAQPMAENMSRAMWAFVVTVLVCVTVSLMTKPKPVAELNGLAYSATVLPKAEPVPFYKSHVFWAAVLIVVFIVGNIIFW